MECWLVTRSACLIHHCSDLHILLSQNSQQIGAVSVERKIMASAKYEMRALLVHQGLEEALQGETALDAKLEERDKKILMDKTHSAIILSLGDKVLRQVSKEKTIAGIWSKLEDVTIDDEDQALLLLCALPKSFSHFKETLLCERESLSLVEVQSALNSKVLNERNKQKVSVSGEDLIVRGKRTKRDNHLEKKKSKPQSGNSGNVPNIRK
ncbi:Retrovirus-related Pol polyprotein from transposon TNT 1-94 [Glycine soja]